ncbi:DinB family protein [Mucilaginibacter sp.]|uniref:DinB family protein n=1 Tax=Mucilaginibacter sp. TaxID=1882438 RepID=UPI003D0F6407
MTSTTSQLKTAIDDLLNMDQAFIDWDYRPGANKWSKKEIIGHLIDSAQVNLQRFVRCTYEENFKLIYAQEEWVIAQHYNQAAVTELLTLWRLLNMQIIRVLDNYPKDRLLIKCDNSKIERHLHTVEWLAKDYVAHLKHHLKQLYS